MNWKNNSCKFFEYNCAIDLKKNNLYFSLPKTTYKLDDANSSNLGIFLGSTPREVKLFFFNASLIQFQMKKLSSFCFFKGGLVEEKINICKLTLKFKFSCPELKVRLLFWFLVRKKTEFLIAKHWISWLPVTLKLRRTACK